MCVVTRLCTFSLNMRCLDRGRGDGKSIHFSGKVSSLGFQNIQNGRKTIATKADNLTQHSTSVSAKNAISHASSGGIILNWA